MNGIGRYRVRHDEWYILSNESHFVMPDPKD
jgi:hypothetical protein